LGESNKIIKQIQEKLEQRLAKRYGWMKALALLNLDRELEEHSEEIVLVGQNPDHLYWDSERDFSNEINFKNKRNDSAKRLGQLWEKYGRLECAAEVFSSVRDTLAEDPTLEHAGDLFLEVENPEQAFQAYRRAINDLQYRIHDNSYPKTGALYPWLPAQSLCGNQRRQAEAGTRRDAILAKIKTQGLETYAENLPSDWAYVKDHNLSKHPFGFDDSDLKEWTKNLRANVVVS
jgi:hypothetical protein